MKKHHLAWAFSLHQAGVAFWGPQKITQGISMLVVALNIHLTKIHNMVT